MTTSYRLSLESMERLENFRATINLSMDNQLAVYDHDRSCSDYLHQKEKQQLFNEVFRRFRQELKRDKNYKENFVFEEDEMNNKRI